MSDDLISRKETVKLLRNYADLKCFNGEIGLANGILKAVCYIENDNIPTAYDMGKVIEKLKENEQEMTSQLEESAKNAPSLVQEATLKITAQLFMDYTKSQIEIVKSGGVADE